MRLIGRYLSLILWFGIRGGWIYYVVLAAYAAMVVSGLWLMSRPGWLPILGGWIVLLDGLTLLLFLLYRWLGRRTREAHPPD